MIIALFIITFLILCLILCFGKNNPNTSCKHDWGKWYRFGITWQERECKLCGKKECIRI